jgi:5-formyltetrahydrofolate cyclo-ligase
MHEGTRVDLVLTPGVAFTRRGERLGYGRGYYDMFIAALPGRPCVVGAAYAMQVLEALPTEPHDRRVHLVVTERETIDTMLDSGAHS